MQIHYNLYAYFNYFAVKCNGSIYDSLRDIHFFRNQFLHFDVEMVAYALHAK